MNVSICPLQWTPVSNARWAWRSFRRDSANRPVLSSSQLLELSEDSAPQQTLLDEQNWQNTRLDWATLLKRVYNIDALACPCGGRLKFEELVVERDKVREQLQQRGLSPEPYTPRQRRQLSDREAYAAAPQQDWDQSPQDTSQQGYGESPQTESQSIEPDDSIDWDQSEQSSGGETSLREGKAQVQPDDW